MTEKIEFLVDEKGRRKSVLMSYRTYMELMQDIEDLRVKMERSEETPEDFDKVLKELNNAGRL
ncbi:MAG: hypothetical protein NT018_06160 [Armatimonadetes bacterium]|nr:hypothetical protein [Armatimonadota bacterium]